MKNIGVLFLVAILLVSCSDGTAVVTSKPSSATWLVTVNHDGHLFVIVEGGHGASGVIHHPGCNCLKIKEKK